MAASGSHCSTWPSAFSGTTVVVPSKISACRRPAFASLRIFTAVSVALARVERTLMPYFFSNAAVTGRTSWLTIWVVYQTTSPSRLAAAISAASAAASGRRRQQPVPRSHILRFETLRPSST